MNIIIAPAFLMSLRNLLRGTGVAIVTPFQEDESVDFTALEKLIDFIIGNGVEYIVSLGTTGETPTLTKQEKLDIVGIGPRWLTDRVAMVTALP